MLAPVSSRAAVRTIVALSTAMVLVAACADTDQGVVTRRAEEIAAPLNTDPDNPLNPTDSTMAPLPAAAQVIDFGVGKVPQPYDDFLNAAFTDLQEFWAAELPAAYGLTFEPVLGIYALYPERQDLPELCGDVVPYEAVEGNAFYAGCGDVIVYDDYYLLPDLVERLGAAAVGVVAAHEYGHAIQNRSGFSALDLPVVDGEQQADCFAGAWAARVARGESSYLQFTDQDVKGGLIAMIEIRDEPGGDVTEGNGHGTAFDRVGAFQEGFINGATRCATFVENPYPRVDLEFTTEEEFATGGNLPLEEIVAAMPITLDVFWAPTLAASGITFTSPTITPFPTNGPYPECDGLTGEELRNRATFCVSTNTVVYDNEFVTDLYGRLGDLALGYPIAEAFSDAVQVALGSGLTGEPRVLLNDCLVGSWLVDIVPNMNPSQPDVIEPINPNQEIVLSSGDLDEVVLTAVILGDEATSTDVNGSAFEKIDAFRTGVLGGLNGCQSLLG
jgi:predicted metalloprotease